MISNLEEVRARSGRIIGVGFSNDEQLADLSDHVFPVVQANLEILQPILFHQGICLMQLSHL